MFQPKGGIYEPGLNIPLNGSDMQGVFEYRLLGAITQNKKESQKPIRDKLSRSKEEYYVTDSPYSC